MNEGATARTVMAADEVLTDPRGVARSNRVTNDGDVVIDTRGRQINPLPATMTVAETLEDSLGPSRASDDWGFTANRVEHRAAASEQHAFVP